MKKRQVGFLAILMAFVLAGMTQAQTWDMVADFSVTSGNPNGLWSYGYYAGGASGTFTLYGGHSAGTASPLINWFVAPSDTDGHGNVNKNITVNTFSQATWAPGMSWRPGQVCLMAPYSANWNPNYYDDDTAVRFTVPSAGSYQFTAEWENRVMTGTATDVFVRVNGSQVFSDQISGFAETAPAPAPALANYSNVLSLNAGDAVDFGVSGVVNDGGHQVGLTLTVAPGELPEPTMNLVMKLDAGVGVKDPNRPSVTLVDGDTVGLWEDQSAAGLLDATTKWGTPILKTDGVFDVIRFDGNDGMVIYNMTEPNDQAKFLDPEDPNDTPPLDLGTYTIYVVGKLNQTVNTSQIFLADYAATGRGYSVGVSDVLPDYVKFWTNSGGEMRSSGPIDDTGRYYLISAAVTQTWTKQLFVNDCQEATGNGGSTYTDAMVASVGALGTGTGSQFLKGDIAEIRVYDGYIDATHQTIVNELSNKYGLNRECLGGPDPDKVALTALTFFGTSEIGWVRENARWNTLWEDGAWDVALSAGTVAEIAALTDPNDFAALNVYDNMSIYQNMEKGQSYTFSWVCPTSGEDPGLYYGMNFFFDSAEDLGKSHGISVFANELDPGETSATFLADESQTMGWPISTVTGAGTLIYKDFDKNLSVTLTDWKVYHPTVYNIDVVTRQDAVSGVSTHALSGPDGSADMAGQFTLTVADYTPNCDDLSAMGREHIFWDFNQDCYVNLEDFAQFAQNWLRCNDPANAGCEQGE